MSHFIQKVLIIGGGIGLAALAYFLFVQPDQFELEAGVC
jgi:glycine/D-amino acid oxidase-like deaminating enzyme